ncbi:transposase [Parafrankia sp. FMc2]|uniref:transposase n=1 Tax=Parafrankia sp. FMc2 TaxID=3233196 RepID=UPI0034D76697
MDARSNEIPALPARLADLDLTGEIVTVDALHTQTETARWLIGRGAHYVLTVKANQPSLHAPSPALAPGDDHHTHRRAWPRPPRAAHRPGWTARSSTGRG